MTLVNQIAKPHSSSSFRMASGRKKMVKIKGLGDYMINTHMEE